MATTLTIHLLGDFRILTNDKPLTTISADRQQTLLAYLLLHRHAPQSRQHLAFQLWPDSPEGQARTNLRNLLYSLRQAIPDADTFIASDNLVVQWRPGAPFQLDVAQFEAALAQAGKTNTTTRRLALEAAIAAYTGDLLPGNYDDWLAPLREELRRRFLDALQRLIDLLTTSSDYRRAIHYSQRCLAQDPLNEPAYVQLMRLHALSGDRAGVRRVYQQCVAALERELEVEPSPATNQAYEQLLRLAPAPAPVNNAPPPSPSSSPSSSPSTATAPLPSADKATPYAPPRLQPKPVPTPATPLLGRQAELTAIAAQLRDPACRLLTLVGMGGMGKTRLALQVAATVGPPLTGGVVFVPLVGVQESALIWPSLAVALNLILTGAQPPAEQVLTALADGSFLLVLDNLEQLLGDITPISALLEGAPSLKLLVTSRERLNLQEEWVYEVTGLAIADQLTATTAGNDATALFVQMARRTRSRFTPDGADMVAIQRICQLVEGMPLGIELAAAWVHLLSPAEIAQEIERNLDFLATPARNVPERHRTLRAVFDHSWQLLTAAEQQTLRRLAVFRGGFTRELAKTVSGATLPLLATLVDKSLLYRAPGGRYELHERVRQYAYRKLHETGDAEATHQAHLRHFIHFAQENNQQLGKVNHKVAVARLVDERDNLYAALQWALDHEQIDEGLHLAQACSRFWRLTGAGNEGLQWFTQLLAQSGQLRDRSLLTGAFYHAGQQAWAIRAVEQTQYYLQEALRLAQGEGDRLCEADVYNSLGVVVGDHARAERYHEQALAIYRVLNEARGIVFATLHLASLASGAGDHARAIQLYTECLAYGRRGDDLMVRADSLRGLAITYFSRQQYGEAAQLYNEVMAIYQAMGDEQGVYVVQNDLGDVALIRGQLAEATTYYRASLAGAWRYEDHYVIAWGFECLARTALAQHQVERALLLFAAAGRLFQAIGARLRLDNQAEREQFIAQARNQAGEALFARAWAAGSAMSATAAYQMAMGEPGNQH